MLFSYMDSHLRAGWGRQVGLKFDSLDGGPPLSPQASSLSLQILLGQKETSGNQRSLEEQLDPKWDPTSSNLRNSPDVLSRQSVSCLQLSSFHQRLVLLIGYLQVACTATNHSVAGKRKTSELMGKTSGK